MDQKEKHFDHIWTSFEIKKMCVKKLVITWLFFIVDLGVGANCVDQLLYDER